MKRIHLLYAGIGIGIAIGIGFGIGMRSATTQAVSPTEKVFPLSAPTPVGPKATTGELVKVLGETWRQAWILGFKDEAFVSTKIVMGRLAREQPGKFLEILDGTNEAVESWMPELEQAVAAMDILSTAGGHALSNIRNPRLKAELLAIAASQGIDKGNFQAVAQASALLIGNRDEFTQKKVISVWIAKAPERVFEELLKLPSSVRMSVEFLERLGKKDPQLAARLAAKAPKGSQESALVMDSLRRGAIERNPGAATLTKISQEQSANPFRMVGELTLLVESSLMLKPEATIDWVLSQSPGIEKYSMLDSIARTAAVTQPHRIEEIFKACPSLNRRANLAESAVSEMLKNKTLKEVEEWTNAITDSSVRQTIRDELSKKVGQGTAK
jgi:hypothetical protein